MELPHLRYFIALAQSFVKAARPLRVAQPALSKPFRDLEYELSVTLFDRLPRGVRLTGSGQAFLAGAESSRGRHGSSRDELADRGGWCVGARQPARLGAPIPAWLALVSLPDPSSLVRDRIAIASTTEG